MYQSNLKILHLADLHLARNFQAESIIGQSFTERREDIWKTFENSLSFASSSGVDLVLISGDLYENESVSISNLERLAYIFSKYKNINFYIVFGNHDHISSKSNYLKSIVPSNVFIFDNKFKYYQYKNLRIYGYSWDRKEYYDLPFIVEELDPSYFNILLLHGTVGSSSAYLPIDLKYFKSKGFDYLALGHIHKAENIDDFAFYPGSIEPMSFKHQGDHGGILLRVKNKDFSTEFIKFSTSIYISIDIDISKVTNNQELLKLSYDSLKNVNYGDYIKVKFIGYRNKDIDIKEVILYLENRFDHIEIKDSTELDIDFEELLKRNRDNIIGKYFKEVITNYSGEEKDALIEIGIESLLKDVSK